MHRVLIVWGLLLSCFLGGVTHAAIVDTLVAVVNDQVICRSSITMYMTYSNQFHGSGAHGKLTYSEALNLLINRMLMLQTIKRTSDLKISDEEVSKVISQQFAANVTRELLETEMSRYGWTWNELFSWIKDEILINRFFEERFTNFIIVNDDEVKARLEQEFKTDPVVVNAPESKALMKKLITQERLNKRINEWVDELRTRNTVIILDAVVSELPKDESPIQP